MIVKTGKVYLVGAGPGDPELISLKGANLLAIADTIVYDRLIPSLELLPIRPSATMIDVGKEAKKHRRKQSEINEILIEEARKGNVVVRLKGGDCFVFGRGGEEAIELKKAGIAFEIVPGITSSISVPAFAGIPVTHRGVSTEFAVITGHEDPTKGDSTINWPHLATAVHTLVFLMGVKNLPHIVEKLMQYGRSGDTKAAIIYKGCSWEQKTLTCTLSELPVKAKEAGFEPPSITIIGDVVGLRDEIGHWFDQLPLKGKTFLCTRPKGLNRELALAISRLGGRPLISPLIRTETMKSPELKETIATLSDFDWTIFTSARGVDTFFQAMKEEGYDARAFGKGKVCVIGSATADSLEQYGIRPDLIPEAFTAEGIIKAFKEHLLTVSDLKILIPRAKGAREILVKELTRAGAHVTEIHTYTTDQTGVFTAETSKALMSGNVDSVILCSPSTAESYGKALKELAQSSGKPLPSPSITTIGPITGERARELDLPVAKEASVHTIQGIIDTISRD